MRLLVIRQIILSITILILLYFNSFAQPAEGRIRYIGEITTDPSPFGWRTIDSPDSNFSIGQNTIPKQFNVITVKTLQFQKIRSKQKVTADERKWFQKIKPVFSVFGFYKGRYSFIVDTDNDGSFINEPVFDARPNQHINILVKNAEVLNEVTGGIEQKTLLISYAKNTIGLNSDKIADSYLFFSAIPYLKFEKKINGKLYTILRSEKPPFTLFKGKHLYDYIIVDKKLKVPCEAQTFLKYNINNKVYLKNGVFQISDNGMPDLKVIQNKNISKLGYEKNFVSLDIAGEDIISNMKINSPWRNSKLLIIDFWGTWCGPCVKMESRLLSIFYKKRQAGLDILGVAFDQSKSDVRNFLIQNKVGWKNIFDDRANPNLTSRFHIFTFPTLLFVDKSGVILKRISTENELGKVEEITDYYIKNLH